jgi:hypothetical protein
MFRIDADGGGPDPWRRPTQKPSSCSYVGRGDSAGQVVPNLVVVEAGPGGLVRLSDEAGAAHVGADIVGWLVSR